MDWRKSTFSSNGVSCVEVAIPGPRTTLMRNSVHPDRGTLAFASGAVAAFVAACRAGDLDDLAI
jgi:hypothetical protein